MKVGSKEWLEACALFGCQVSECAEEVSYHADMLKLWKGEPICEECFSQVIGDDTPPSWGDLDDFNPFECLAK